MSHVLERARARSTYRRKWRGSICDKDNHGSQMLIMVVFDNFVGSFSSSQLTDMTRGDGQCTGDSWSQ